jgi:AcrR family transcriptional regulator
MQTGSHRKGSSRLSSEERRQAIIASVKTVFAKKGFDRTTSQELARAAGVSQALLYKYFPTKMSLYNATVVACAEAPEWLISNHIRDLEPSTATLVVMIDSLISQVVEPRSVYFDGVVLGRLAIRSLIEDGDFARTMLRPFTNNWVDVFEKCFRSAAESGDLREFPTAPHVGAWLIFHIALGLMLQVSPKTPIDYNVPKHTLVQQAVRFALRGIGLKEEPLKLHYNSRLRSGLAK